MSVSQTIHRSWILITPIPSQLPSPTQLPLHSLFSLIHFLYINTSDGNHYYHNQWWQDICGIQLDQVHFVNVNHSHLFPSVVLWSDNLGDLQWRKEPLSSSGSNVTNSDA